MIERWRLISSFATRVLEWSQTNNTEFMNDMCWCIPPSALTTACLENWSSLIIHLWSIWATLLLNHKPQVSQYLPVIFFTIEPWFWITCHPEFPIHLEVVFRFQLWFSLSVSVASFKSLFGWPTNNYLHIPYYVAALD